MIKFIRINNIALIQSLELELAAGLVLLTGETGAGKSIVIDSLGLLLGDRASPELIRTGEDRAVVEAAFEAGGAHAFLVDRGLPVDGDEVVIRREIQSSGKGKATVNGALVPIALLRDLAPWLAVIHGQHEPQGLLDPDSHLDILDHIGADAGLRAAVAEAYRQYRAAEAALDRLRADRRAAERRVEMLEFQADEIEKAGLQPGEDEALRLEKVKHANAGRLATLSSEAYALLYDEEAAAVALLGQVYRRVEDLSAIDPDFVPFVETKASVLAPLEDLALRLRDYRDTLDIAPGRLDEIESRLAQIERLKKKYGATVEEVIAFGHRSREELSSLGTPEEQERALEARRVDLARAYLDAATRLSRSRRDAAATLRTRVHPLLAQLAMEKTRFDVAFEPDDTGHAAEVPAGWTERGLERAEFVLSPNPGETLRPLARIASGGELSRLMLALKSATESDASGLTLVFDEVDAGIGGRVAEVVGRQLRAISARRQVLCITHLPQIAAFADQHLAVRKKVERGRTTTHVDALTGEARIDEVARMLGGETITAAGREHAAEMLKLSLRG